MASPGATGRERPSLDDAATARYKHAAALEAAELVTDGMRVGLGTGSTVAHLLAALAQRGLRDLMCVPTSPATERAARAAGLTLSTLEHVGELDIAIDGADQVSAEGWLIKGGGGALTREKIVAAAARAFVVIVSADKAVSRLGPPVPLELVPFGISSTLRAIGNARARAVPASPDGGVIADYLGEVEDPCALATRLSAIPGVVEHGLFEPELVSTILIAGAQGIERREGARRS